MITALLGRELRARFPGDPVPEDGLLALEFTGLVIGVDPVSNLVGLHRVRMLSESTHLGEMPGRLTAMLRAGGANGVEMTARGEDDNARNPAVTALGCAK